MSVDYATLGRATRDVHAKFPTFDFFSASWVFIATWHNVTFFGASARPFPVTCTIISYHIDTQLVHKIKELKS